MALTARDLTLLRNAIAESVVVNVKKTIEEEVPKAMRAQFIKIGLATEDEDDQIDAQQDFSWLRKQREQSERTAWYLRSRIIQWAVTLVGGLLIAGAGAVAMRQPPTPPL